MSEEKVNHPSHYGGVENIYEVIKVIDAWQANFNLGNALKYICRVCWSLYCKGHPSSPEFKMKALEDLKKAKAYLEFEIAKLEK